MNVFSEVGRYILFMRYVFKRPERGRVFWNMLVREMNLTNGSNRNAEFTMNGTPGLYRVQVVTEAGDLYSDFLSFQ